MVDILGASNEYPEHLFLWKILKKNMKNFWLEKVSYLELWHVSEGTFSQ